MAVASTFAGFPAEGIQFMADLAANNDRAWFQPRKSDYERLVKEPMELLMIALAERFEARGIPLVADPKRSPFRIYRDTRFSRDKSPYKTHIGASMPWVEGSADGAPVGETGAEGGGDGPHGNGAYFNFQPGEMYAGGGMWMASKPRLDAFRRLLVDDPARVHAALDDPAFVAWFGGVHSHETLKRVPPGYPADHPDAEWLRWKDVVFGRQLADDEVCSKDLPDLLADGYGAAIPVFRFLAELA